MRNRCRRRGVSEALARRLLRFGGKTRVPTLAHVSGQLPHRLFRNDPPFAMCNGCFRYVHGFQNFRATPLAFFPKRKGFLRRLVRSVQTSGLDSLTIERGLVGGQIYFHAVSDVKRRARREPARRIADLSRSSQYRTRSSRAKLRGGRQIHTLNALRQRGRVRRGCFRLRDN
jgi:hypothetical protein